MQRQEAAALADEHRDALDVDRHHVCLGNGDGAVAYSRRREGHAHRGRVGDHARAERDVEGCAAACLELDRAVDVKIGKHMVGVARDGGLVPVHPHRQRDDAVGVERAVKLHAARGPDLQAVDTDELDVRERRLHAEIDVAAVVAHRVAGRTAREHQLEIRAGREEPESVRIDGRHIEPAVARQQRAAGADEEVAVRDFAFGPKQSGAHHRCCGE